MSTASDYDCPKCSKKLRVEAAGGVEGVDLLVHEALAPQLVAQLTAAAQAAGNERLAKITRDILTYHATPVEAAEIARQLANLSPKAASTSVLGPPWG